MIHSRPMRDLDQISQPGHDERARTPHGIVPVELRGPVHWAASHSTPQCWVERFRCAMLAFVRDPFMTSHASPGPVPVDLLGLNNGLVHK